MSVAKVIEITASSPTQLRRGGEGGDRKGVGDGPRHQGRLDLRGERRRRERPGDRVPRDDARELRARLVLFASGNPRKRIPAARIPRLRRRQTPEGVASGAARHLD